MSNTHPVNRSRRPRRRFLALSSDALYTSEPVRRLESTMIPDPPEVVELIAAAVSLKDEPECVSDAILDTYGRDAAYFRSVRHAAEVEGLREQRAGMSHERRVLDAEARAKVQHRSDVRGDLLALGKALERARRSAGLRLVEGVDGFARGETVGTVSLSGAALERLERVEAMLDRAPELKAA
jgi:hypothetical protein